MSDLKALVASLNKKFGNKEEGTEHIIGFASELQYDDVPRLSTGSLFLDYSLGKNKKDNTAGWPMGRIIELYGPESSGKSLICLKTIAEAQKLGMMCAYIDCENSFDNKFATTLGVDPSKLLITRESQAERVIDLAVEILRQSPNIKVIIFDSLASMIPSVEEEANLEDQQMASMARVMSKGLRKLVQANKNRALLIFINQLRENPGAKYGNPEYTPGGRALKFYASIRAEIKKGDWIEDKADGEKKKRIGQTVRFRITKNKTDDPWKEGYFKFIYEHGELDPVDQLVSLGLLNEIIGRKGAYYFFGNDGEYTFQGRESMEEALKKKPEVFEALKREVFGEVKEEKK